MFFLKGGGKHIMNLALYGLGQALRPEVEVSDRPEARQIGSFGWRDHEQISKIIYDEKPQMLIIAGPHISFSKSSHQFFLGKM